LRSFDLTDSDLFSRLDIDWARMVLGMMLP